MKLSDGDVLIFPEMTLYRYEQNLVWHINLVMSLQNVVGAL